MHPCTYQLNGKRYIDGQLNTVVGVGKPASFCSYKRDCLFVRDGAFVCSGTVSASDIGDTAKCGAEAPYALPPV